MPYQPQLLLEEKIFSSHKIIKYSAVSQQCQTKKQQIHDVSSSFVSSQMQLLCYRTLSIIMDVVWGFLSYFVCLRYETHITMCVC